MDKTDRNICNRADMILSKYRYYRAKADKYDEQLHSQRITGMPSSSTIVESDQDKGEIKAIPYRDYCYKCSNTIEIIKNEENVDNGEHYSYILTYYYLVGFHPVPMAKIADKLQISRQTAYKRLDEALLAFGRNCPKMKFPKSVK